VVIQVPETQKKAGGFSVAHFFTGLIARFRLNSLLALSFLPTVDVTLRYFSGRSENNMKTAQMAVFFPHI